MELAKVKGLREVKRNLDMSQAMFAKKIEHGLKRGAALVHRKSQETVPVDQGNLKGGGKVNKKPGTSGLTTHMIVGYSAEYAVFVHEDLQKAHGRAFNIKHAAEIAAGTENSRGDNQRAKFLENAVRENLDAIFTEITTG
jgi:hypothetical protein